MKREMIDDLKKRLRASRVVWEGGKSYPTEAETAAADCIEELVKERDDLGRKLNAARYGQPDFAWSIHEEAMADLRAKLTKAVEALREIKSVECVHCTDYFHELADAVLAELEGE
jgi:hypothetical protein